VATEDNGLRAAAYTPLGRLDADAAAEALDTLRAAGVAAYVEPAGEDAPGEEGNGEDVGRGGAGVAEEGRRVLWVDAAAAERARALLGPDAPLDRAGDREPRGGGASGRASSPHDDTFDESAWEAIVAAYDAPSEEGERPWPASEDLDPGDEHGDVPDDRARGHAGAGEAASPAGGTGRAPGGVPARPHAEDDEDHFVPPVPPPPPRGDAVTRWAWAGVLGGPVFLFATALVGAELPGWLALLVVGAFVAGFVTLVARMKDRPPRDSGGGDGGVVFPPL
jgi:hypothetical protein